MKIYRNSVVFNNFNKLVNKLWPEVVLVLKSTNLEHPQCDFPKRPNRNFH